MMKLFTIGPSQMFPNVLNVHGQLVPYFRNEDFSNSVLNITRMIKQTMYAPVDSEVILLTASGSGAMEALVDNCFSYTDKLLVVNGGTFGERFVQICVKHQIPYDVITIPFDKDLTENELLPFEGKHYTAMLVNIHETSIGKLYNVDILSSFCQRNNMFFIVDAISSYLCDVYDMGRYGIDATIISSQKGLCCSPGISFVVISKRLDEYRNGKQTTYQYFDFNDYLVDGQRGQTPYTPAVGVVLEIEESLRGIEIESLDKRLEKVKANATYFRENVHRIEATIPSYSKSFALTPVVFNKPIAKQIFKYLSNQGLIINPCGGGRADRMIRVAHIGDLSIEDHEELIYNIEIFNNKQKE